MDAFWNRAEELGRIRRWAGRGKLGFVTGRRRVGKSATLLQAVQRFGGLYHQAVEGTAGQQLLHATEEMAGDLLVFKEFQPKNWTEFFRLLSREKLPPLLVFDEFPYWASGDPSLPSVLQKWVDHELPGLKTSVLISGSSQAMLYSHLLNQSAPLYGRASLHLHLEPMSYGWFCRALGYAPADPVSFARFSLVGGVPHYWKLLSPRKSFIHQAQELYFEPSALLAEEPIQMIRDEGIAGALPKAILDLIGRGVAKPSELAGRLGIPQGNLSRPLALLLGLGLIRKELPFGESPRTTKRVLYQVLDPVLSFYYGTFLPARSRWPASSETEKQEILNLHVSRQWENFCRQIHPGAGRYWEAGMEIDLVFYDKKSKTHIIGECKWKLRSPHHRQLLLEGLQDRFGNSRLSRVLKKVQFKVFSQEDLSSLSRGA